MVLFSIRTEERDALREVAESQKGTLNDVWDPFNKQEWQRAEPIFRQFLQDCRFLEALLRHEPDEEGWVNVDVGAVELHEALQRMMAKRTAQLVIEESAGVPTLERELFQQSAWLR